MLDTKRQDVSVLAHLPSSFVHLHPASQTHDQDLPSSHPSQPHLLVYTSLYTISSLSSSSLLAPFLLPLLALCIQQSTHHYVVRL